MKGNTQIIELLNQVLTNELTGINQYFVHAKMCENWGYSVLAGKLRDESIDEMKHADQVIDRILYLEGVPNLQRLGKVNVGQTVPEQMKLDHALEKDAIEFLSGGITTATEAGDHGTRELLASILVSEEAHLDWIEEQIHLIDKLGEQHYLAQQLR